MSKITFGIDLGGTGIKFALVDEHGRMLRNTKVSTPSKRDPQEVLELMEAEAKAMLGTLKQPARRSMASGSVQPATWIRNRATFGCLPICIGRMFRSKR